MKLGAFSISLAIKDLAKSKAFYEQLGFTQFAGEMERNYLIMKNGETVIGLFQGMFEHNLLTFNPGWTQSAENVDPFDDVREIQKNLKSAGIALEREANEEGTGPDHAIVVDPDGNAILIDQHR